MHWPKEKGEKDKQCGGERKKEKRKKKEGEKRKGEDKDQQNTIHRAKDLATTNITKIRGLAQVIRKGKQFRLN